ncbi:hypothetical protein E1301_Tti008299 [Triplophysa tibetana]|uniref:Uncharacterized protein n=1 Tax=Triplophysa tibetana TaxID=1572043 RepID=A0A5A9PCB1_9TELE|nr:hypothetical protein E1301_Tti008299 [Triplophysa tibetana]
MTAPENSNSKQERPTLRFPYNPHRPTNVMILKNGQRGTKHPRTVPIRGELPSLAGDQSFITTNREDYPSYTPDGTPIAWQTKAPLRPEKTVQEKRSSLYQQDFSAPKRIYVRRNQAVPHPDNLAFNTSLRAEYRTVQREAFPGWDVSVHAPPVPVQIKRTAVTEL